VCQRKDWSSSHKFECPNFKARRQLEAKAAAAGNSKPPFLDRHEDAPVPQQVLFPYELFMQLRKNPNSCRRAPVGLINHGNNCYANAALQCLLYTKPLRAFLDQGLHNKGCNKPHDRDWCLLCVLTVREQAIGGRCGTASSGLSAAGGAQKPLA
jgi:ubiquitin C-terminal hydrolase